MRPRTPDTTHPSAQGGSPSVPPKAPAKARQLLLLAAALASLRERFAAHAPDAALHALFAGQISDDAAAERGARLTADAVLDAAANDMPLVADAVLQGAVPGFGPAEFCYTLDLGIELARRTTALTRDAGEQAAASARKSDTLRDLRRRSNELYALVSSVVPASGSDRAAFEQRVQRNSASRSEAVSSLSALGDFADELLARAATSPTLTLYYADKGFTAERVYALVSPGTAVQREHTAHSAAKARVQGAAGVIDTLEGRLRDQLLRLRRAVEARRHAGTTLPEVALRGVRRRPTRAKKRRATPPGGPGNGGGAPTG